MTTIVELREMSNEKLQELLENAREEMFNLRFQKASARLENTARIKEVRREIARLQTVLNMRQQAVDVAVDEPEIAAALAGKQWQANARFSYEDSAWLVTFSDENGTQLATASVNLNKKQPKGRAARAKETPRLVTSFEIAG
ncbi:MAG: 50S ribosomal protein L29 [Candidatus Thermofonsia bacterium]|nr:MAG: 50S ribosomal protein L29 [Candidatus Thermofonsia bacterium]